MDCGCQGLCGDYTLGQEVITGGGGNVLALGLPALSTTLFS